MTYMILTCSLGQGSFLSSLLLPPSCFHSLDPIFIAVCHCQPLFITIHMGQSPPFLSFSVALPLIWYCTHSSSTLSDGSFLLPYLTSFAHYSLVHLTVPRSALWSTITMRNAKIWWWWTSAFRYRPLSRLSCSLVVVPVFFVPVVLAFVIALKICDLFILSFVYHCLCIIFLVYI